MYLIEYKFNTSTGSTMTDMFENLVEAYDKLYYYQHSENYSYSKLYKLTPVEVKLSAVEIIEEI